MTGISPPPAPLASVPAYTPPPAPVYTPEPVAPAPLVDTSVYYENCSAVRAAGAAPIYAGEPGYDDHLDGDGDGVGCEN